jgi:hypothetical protein
MRLGPVLCILQPCGVTLGDRFCWEARLWASVRQVTTGTAQSGGDTGSSLRVLVNLYVCIESCGKVVSCADMSPAQSEDGIDPAALVLLLLLLLLLHTLL